MADWDRILADASAHGIAQRNRNRELVLRYPDIAAKLTAAPFKCADPKTWTGFIPGPYLPEDADGRTRRNDSPIRAQLLAIVTEAAERADHEKGAS